MKVIHVEHCEGTSIQDVKHKQGFKGIETNIYAVFCIKSRTVKTLQQNVFYSLLYLTLSMATIKLKCPPDSVLFIYAAIIWGFAFIVQFLSQTKKPFDWVNNWQSEVHNNDMIPELNLLITPDEEGPFLVSQSH